MENIINAAQIENELVTNVIVVTDINFLPNLVAIPEGASVGIGWSYVNGVFKPAPISASIDTVKVEPTKEELMAELTALTAKIQLLSAI